MTGGVDVQVSELLGLAEGLFNAGNLHGATEILSALNVVSPSNAPVLTLLGVVAATRGGHAEAGHLLDQAGGGAGAMPRRKPSAHVIGRGFCRVGPARNARFPAPSSGSSPRFPGKT